MLIIISSPTTIANEADYINALFEEGLEILHLRKPDILGDELKLLFDNINPVYYSQIALHQHHEIINEKGIARLHFTEVKRKEMSEEGLKQLEKSNHILSTSIHQIEDYPQLSPCFSYTFFGPVFNSISKRGYTSTLSNGFVFPVEKSHSKVIAIGGINATNMQQAMNMKFNGVGVLGAIWEKPKESIQQFKAIQKAWKQADQ
jgi:thiamine-phosphate pyrophosphorylase